MGRASLGGEGRESSFPPQAPESRHGIPPLQADPWAGRRAGLRHGIQRARQYQDELDRRLVDNAAALAAREGVTRARISQLLRLLRLAPAILAELDDEAIHGPAPAERDLRRLPDAGSEARQLAAYRQLCEQEAGKLQTGKAKPRRAASGRGLAHLFEKARAYHRALDTKQARSIAALGRAEGVSASRVGQVMVLLYLAPDIIERVESAVEPPVGITERGLRRIARIRDHEQQRREFAVLLARGQAAARANASK